MLIDLLVMIKVSVKFMFLEIFYFRFLKTEELKHVNFWQKYLGLKLAITLLTKNSFS